jgi:uncharacterized pyridoxal phosphate-containing UPF0001 family protein
VHDVGESRQQELTAKRGETTAAERVRWHFIGQLQTKKAKAVRAASDCVHSVDRDRVADALHAADPEGSPLDVFLQVNLTDDPPAGSGARATSRPGDAHRRAVRVAAPSRCHGRRPLAAAPAEAFERLAGAATVRRVVPDAAWMSAGMSGDFAEAIAAARHTCGSAPQSRDRALTAASLRTDEQTEECDVEPAQEDHGVPGPRR